MNEREYGYFGTIFHDTLPEEFHGSICYSDFSKNECDRTLLMGFWADVSGRGTTLQHHVYLRDGVVHLLTYLEENLQPRAENHETVFGSLGQLIPSKSIWPEKSDFDFCKWLYNQGIRLPFSRYAEIEQYTYYGEIFDPVSQGFKTLP